VQPLTCAACGYEFETPVPSQAGPACPRCGETAGAAADCGPVAGVAEYLSAALAGAMFGLFVASLLFLSRF